MSEKEIIILIRITSIQKGWNVSAVSFHKVMQVLYKKDAMNEWGVLLPYRIWQRSVFRIIMMADNKTYSQLPQFGYFGRDKKVRVNTISQSPTATKQVKLLNFNGFIAFADKMAPLGNASALDCANYTVAMFSDLTKWLLQNLYMMADSLIWE
jgi:enoyl-[acyl-carrier protein] reductase I